MASSPAVRRSIACRSTRREAATGTRTKPLTLTGGDLFRASPLLGERLAALLANAMTTRQGGGGAGLMGQLVTAIRAACHRRVIRRSKLSCADDAGSNMDRWSRRCLLIFSLSPIARFAKTTTLLPASFGAKSRQSPRADLPALETRAADDADQKWKKISRFPVHGRHPLQKYQYLQWVTKKAPMGGSRWRPKKPTRQKKIRPYHPCGADPLGLQTLTYPPLGAVAVGPRLVRDHSARSLPGLPSKRSDPDRGLATNKGQA